MENNDKREPLERCVLEIMSLIGGSMDTKTKNILWVSTKTIEELSNLRELLEKSLKQFQHFHVASEEAFSGDTCKECGLDLRDSIHKRN